MAAQREISIFDYVRLLQPPQSWLASSCTMGTKMPESVNLTIYELTGHDYRYRECQSHPRELFEIIIFKFPYVLIFFIYLHILKQKLNSKYI